MLEGDWTTRMLAGEDLTPEENRDGAQKAAEVLEELLEKEPALEAGITAVLHRHFQGGVSPDTWGTVYESLVRYLDKNLGTFLTWITSPEAAEIAASLVSTPGQPRTGQLLREILGVYGQDFQEALAVWGEIPNNWRTVRREVHYDVIAERYVVQLWIDKYNGETEFIEGSADSILGLTHSIIHTLQATKTPTAFDPEKVDALREEFNSFLALFAEDQAEGIAPTAAVGGEPGEGSA